MPPPIFCVKLSVRLSAKQEAEAGESCPEFVALELEPTTREQQRLGIPAAHRSCPKGGGFRAHSRKQESWGDPAICPSTQGSSEDFES